MLPQPVTGKVADFMRAPVAVLGDDRVMVKDVVKHARNVLGGGGHVGGSKAEYEIVERFRSWWLLALFGEAPGRRELRSIGRVTLRGLQPLRDAVRADLGE